MGIGFRAHPRAAECLRAMMVVTATAVALVAPAHATTLPAGFQESTAFSGLTQPMAIEFAPNGRVFVAEKGGVIKTYANLADTSATQVADFRTKVHNYWDRGLMNIAVDPNFPDEPWVYVFYVHDAAIGGTAPRWGQPNQTEDTCPTPPGGTGDGCVVSGRISRLQVSGETMTGTEQVLIEDFCQQYPSHAGGGLEFGADGYLYYSGGDGAAWHFDDYGQDGNPVNPCGDPPGGVGGPMSPPTAEGGRLRSQDIRSSADPLGLDGTIIRIDPDTGAGVPGNPLFSSTNANERRIIAYGTRNAFRLAIRPGAGDVWVGDVGLGSWEEINRVTSPFGGPRNFGWPCYEGGLDSGGNPASLRLGEMDNLNLNICESLYSAGTAVAPQWAYRHRQKIVAGENCNESAGSALSGLAFAPAAGGFPDSYDGALFFSDYARRCIWALRTDANGLPDPTQRVAFAQAADSPVDLEFGPIGDLFYPDIDAGNIRKIHYTGNPSNLPPTAVATASPQSGNVPLEVNFSGTGSTDPNPSDTLSYAWDLDDDNQLDDSTSATPSFTYTTPGVYTVTLRVTDLSGAFDDDTVTIDVDSAPPTPSIDTPGAGTTWGVGQALAFSGSATDPEDGTLPGTALDWTWIMHHCTSPGNCHTHTIETIPDTAGGTFVAPDHEYPSHLELRLTATDSHNNAATVSRQLDPRTVDITVASDTPEATVSLRSSSGPAPVTATVIEGSANTISAPSPQTLGNTTYEFSSWSDGQAQTHNVAPASSATYTARFAPIAPGTATLTFNPEADAYVDEASPTTNFGDAATLRTDDGGRPGVESYLGFLIDGLNGKVQSAKLRLFSTSNTVDGPEVFSTSNAWAESTIDWNNKPAPSGGALSDSGGIATGVWTEWDVTPAVTAEGQVSFRLASAVSHAVDFHSRESATVTGRPELVLTVLNDSFPRPKGATPLRVPLVPAYNACTSSNRTHGAPLVHPSCNPPVRSSSDLTVGTPDANGGPANSSGAVKLVVIPGTQGAPDEADVTVDLSLTDVRNVAGLTDYAGEVQMRAVLQITDRANGAAADEPGTVQVVEVPINATCAVTAVDPAVGSTCGVTTTFDAVVPGMIVEGRRSVWEIGQIAVLDGGLDGDADTPGNGVFARQGVFVP